MGRPSEDRLRLRSDPCELDVAQVFAGIIYLIDRDRVFLESLNAPVGTRTCALTCTPSLLQPVHTFPTVVQSCTVCCALGGISNVGGTYGCHRLGVRRARWAPHPWRASLIWRWSYGVFSERRPPRNQWRFRSWRRKGRSERVWDDVVCTAARSFVPFLFPQLGWWGSMFFKQVCVSCVDERRPSLLDNIDIFLCLKWIA